MSFFLVGAPAAAPEAPPRLLLRLPGVYSPEHDTHLLLRTVLAADCLAGARVLDLGTGTGRVALGAAQAGAAEVTAVDISRRAVLATRLNAAVNRLPVRAVRGDMVDAVIGRQFDVVLANPPYVPAPGGPPGRHSRARAWDAGPDGRALLDRICADAPTCLAPGGRLWIVHSALSGPGRTVGMLADAGLDAEVVAEETIPFGPVLRSRAAWLRAQGILTDDQDQERIVVVRGRRP